MNRFKVNYLLFIFLFATILSLHSQFKADSIHAGHKDLSQRAKELHENSLLIDGHNDLPWSLREAGDSKLTSIDLSILQRGFHTDIPRLKQGGMGAQFWSAYVPVSTMTSGSAYKETLTQIDLIKRMIQKYYTDFEFAGSSADIDRIYVSRKIASLIGVEGGHSIENSLSKLKNLYDLGARYMTLTHSKNVDWAESCTDKPLSEPLSSFGEDVVLEMNRLGMMIDISHISERTMNRVLSVTQAPVIASHSSAFTVRKHVRNVPDGILSLIKANGGVIMVNFYSDYVCKDSEKETCSVKHVVDHIDHIVRVSGIDHVGLGSDFDGVPTLPRKLKDVSQYPSITEELLSRGYSEGDIKKVLGLNLMRAFKRVEEVSENLSSR